MPARKNNIAPESAVPAVKQPHVACDDDAASPAAPLRQKHSRDLIRITRPAMVEFVKNAPALAERFELALAKRRDTAEQERLAADAKRLAAEEERLAAAARCQAWIAREALLRAKLVALSRKSKSLRYEAILRGHASANALELTIDQHLGPAFSNPIDFV